MCDSIKMVSNPASLFRLLSIGGTDVGIYYKDL